MVETVTRCDVCRCKINDDKSSSSLYFSPEIHGMPVPSDLEDICNKCELKIDTFILKLVAKRGKL